MLLRVLRPIQLQFCLFKGVKPHWIHLLRLDVWVDNRIWFDSFSWTHQLFRRLQFVFLCNDEVEERWNDSGLDLPQHPSETGEE